MSGPKGASYQVVSPAELRRRAVEAARLRLAAAEGQLEVLTRLAGRDADKAGTAPARCSAEAPDEIDEQTKRVLTHCARLEAVLHQRRIKAVTAQLSVGLKGFGTDLRFLTSPPPTTPATNRGDALRRALNQLVVKATELPDAERATLLPRLEAAARDIDGPDLARAAQIVGSLTGVITDALRRAQADAAFERHRAALLVAYADVAELAPDTWNSVKTAPDEPTLTRLAQALEEARAEAARLADQRFVLAQAADVLRGLGYRVEISDEVGVDAIVARRDDWRHHGLRLVFPEGSREFSTIPEAYGATDTRDDVAFERATCDDVGALMQEFERRGVQARLHSHQRPGTVPVARATETTARRRIQTPRERTL